MKIHPLLSAVVSAHSLDPAAVAPVLRSITESDKLSADVIAFYANDPAGRAAMIAGLMVTLTSSASPERATSSANGDKPAGKAKGQTTKDEASILAWLANNAKADTFYTAADIQKGTGIAAKPFAAAFKSLRKADRMTHNGKPGKGSAYAYKTGDGK